MSLPLFPDCQHDNLKNFLASKDTPSHRSKTSASPSTARSASSYRSPVKPLVHDTVSVESSIKHHGYDPRTRYANLHQSFSSSVRHPHHYVSMTFADDHNSRFNKDTIPEENTAKSAPAEMKRVLTPNSQMSAFNARATTPHSTPHHNKVQDFYPPQFINKEPANPNRMYYNASKFEDDSTIPTNETFDSSTVTFEQVDGNRHSGVPSDINCHSADEIIFRDRFHRHATMANNDKRPPQDIRPDQLLKQRSYETKPPKVFSGSQLPYPPAMHPLNSRDPNISEGYYATHSPGTHPYPMQTRDGSTFQGAPSYASGSEVYSVETSSIPHLRSSETPVTVACSETTVASGSAGRYATHTDAREKRDNAFHQYGKSVDTYSSGRAQQMACASGSGGRHAPHIDEREKSANGFHQFPFGMNSGTSSIDRSQQLASESISMEKQREQMKYEEDASKALRMEKQREQMRYKEDASKALSIEKQREQMRYEEDASKALRMETQREQMRYKEDASKALSMEKQRDQMRYEKDVQAAYIFNSHITTAFSNGDTPSYQSSGTTTPKHCNTNRVSSNFKDKSQAKEKNRLSVLKEIRMVMEMRQKAKTMQEPEEVRLLSRHLDLLNLELDKMSIEDIVYDKTSGEEDGLRNDTPSQSQESPPVSAKEDNAKPDSIKIRAPSAMKAGFEFTAKVNGEVVTATVVSNQPRSWFNYGLSKLLLTLKLYCSRMQCQKERFSASACLPFQVQ